MTTGDRLKALREDHDQTQEQLSKLIGVDRSAIMRWEADKKEMGIKKLYEYCKIYGVSADYILGLPKGLKWPR